jgi:predicted RNase H-like HicB family nuclease
MRYTVVIEPATEAACYGVAVPDLPGCFSAGDTLEEALAGAEDSAAAWIDATLAAGDPVPPPSGAVSHRGAGVRLLPATAKRRRQVHFRVRCRTARTRLTQLSLSRVADAYC